SVLAEAARQQVPPRELATTLIVAVATPNVVVSAQVGDGAVVVRDSSGTLISMTSLPSDGYVNETTFLTSPEALSMAQGRFWAGRASHVAASSDGLQLLAMRMPGGAPH